MMSTKTRLEDELKAAMRAKDELRKRVLRMALAAIRLVEVDRGELDEMGVLGVLQKEIKSRHESIDDARRAGRSDLEAANQDELAVLLEFMPKPLTTAELEDLARQAIAEVRASGLSDTGKVMKVLIPRLEGRATGEQASQMVRSLLLP
jgi:uncharacterized protein YqeY